MSIFDSDYEAHGSVSVSQLGVQRDIKDTYFGDLLMMHPYNGRNTADEIRFDYKKGVTAKWRKYRRIADRKNFSIKIGSSGGSTDSLDLAIIKETYPSASSSSGRWGNVTGFYQGLAEICLDASLGYYIVDEPNYVAVIIDPDSSWTEDTIYVRREYLDSSGNIFFELQDGRVIDSGHRGDKPTVEGYFGIVELPIFGITSGLGKPKMKYYFSTDERLRHEFSANKKIDGYPSISIQDNGNNEQPYYLLGKENEEYDRRADVLDVFGVDFEKISKAIFDPEKIPDYPSEKWDEEYGKAYRDSPELQEKYPSERVYHDNLVHERSESINNTKNITDVHIGPFVTPKTLKWSNVFALKAIFQDILPGVPSTLEYIEMGKNIYGEATIDIASGSLKITHTVKGYSFGRVAGRIEDYKPKIPGSDTENEIIVTNDKRAAYCVVEKGTMKVNTGPTYGIGGTGSKGFDTSSYGDDNFNFAGLTGSGMIAIAVVGEPLKDAARTPTYEYIEVYQPFAKHHIDVLHDGEHGTSQSVIVRGGLQGINDEEYSDVLIYPMTRNAVKYTPMFKRERLIRESMMLVIDGIQVVEIKWYEKTIFQVFFMVVAAVVGCLLTACTTTAALLSGSSAAWGALATYVATTIAAGLVVELIISMIDDPFLAALLVVFAAIAFGYYDTNNLVQMATLAVEATGTYMQKKMTQDLIELEEEMKEFMRNANKKMKELEDKMEEAGITSDTQNNFALNKMTMPPPGETPEDFFERVLNRDLAIIEQRPDLDRRVSVSRALRNF